ncbi:MAG TPA: hypothetical protein VK498_09750 [Ferruginibacter sp.]|nr:hypothetical protein [Ferruginibacter sp.]
MKKPTVLLCWGYNRKNWIESFEALNDDFEFVYLFYMYPSEEQQVFTSNRRIFYTQFSSARDLLNQVQPIKVIFMGLDALQTIAINVQCKRSGIPTYFMTHGSSLAFDDYIDFRFKDRNLLKESLTTKLRSWLFTFKFLIKALGFKYLRALPVLMRFQMQKLKIHPLLAMKNNRTPLRIPSKYMVFSEEDIKFYIELDNCRREDFIVLGNLEITPAINMAKEKGITDGNYLLYVETPLSIIENNEFDIGKISAQECNALISSMNEYAIANELKLIIKLHPYSYSNTFFIQHPNITYDKTNEKEILILNAHAVIFYNSSLAIPCLFFKPCCMFIIGAVDEFQSAIRDLNICAVVDFSKLINDPATISFFTPGEKEKQAFVDKFIGKNADGNGLKRLKKALLD